MNVRLAVIQDYQAEGWPSMDLCADQLTTNLRTYEPRIGCLATAPAFQRVFSRIPGAPRLGFNGDRLLNRHVLLHRVVSRVAKQVDFVHIVDHTYAHLVHAVPHQRAGVYCHDLDAFRSLLHPDREPRPWWFRTLAKRTLRGLSNAAVVFHNSSEVRQQLLEHRLVSPERLIHAPLGVATEFTLRANAEVESPIKTNAPFLLHVGTNTQRKRLDVLLEVFANVRNRFPRLQLVQVGGPWPPHLERQLDRLRIRPFVTQIRDLSRIQLADLYRRSSATLVTSEAEGFGLPMIEALACGAVVIGSDIPALREAGGRGAIYCPIGDLATWTETTIHILNDPGVAPTLDIRLAHAGRFSWQEHSRIIGNTYISLKERLSSEEK